MLLLPTFNVTIRPLIGSIAFTGHEQGHFCGHCQRVVRDFNQSLNLMSNLAATSAASPDGRVCGQFQRSQTLDPHTLTRRLKWFLLALVLVVVQSLTAQEALAQAKQVAAPPHRPRPTTAQKHTNDPPTKTRTVVSGDISDGMVIDEPRDPGNTVYTYVQQMPSFQGGDMGNLVAYIQQQVWRSATTRNREVAGRVFISFTVGKNGLMRDAKIVKGLQPLVDAEVLRVARALTGFAPGQQNGQEVAVSLTVPVTFTSK